MNWSILPYLSAKRREALEKSGVSSPLDLVYLLPRRYIDRRAVYPIDEALRRALRPGTTSGSVQGKDANAALITIVGTVSDIREAGFGRKKRLEVILKDSSGSIKGVWFRGVSYMKKAFSVGDQVAFFGEAKRYGTQVTMAHPEVDVLSTGDQTGDKTSNQKETTSPDSPTIGALSSASQSTPSTAPIQRIVPIYPSGKEFIKARITNRMMGTWIDILLQQAPVWKEFLPESVLKTMDLPSLNKALRMVHQPHDVHEPAIGLERLKFQEFFLFESAMARIRMQQRQKAPGLRVDRQLDKTSLTARFFNDILPFELTDGQKTALADIRRDLASGTQMNRLIQGDVGAGKTVVSIGAMLMVLDAGGQVAMMAPTEILAQQHYHTLTNWLEPLGIRIRLLKGGQKQALRTDILTEMQADPVQGGTQIVIGTHAIIQDQVQFARLGLAVIDEQHRFGVAQRSRMLAKGDHPHLLVMSATPIPRSLAMSIYSDLDITAVKGLPGGRKPVITAVRNDQKREDLYSFLEQQLQEGGQAYVVYPLVEESELLDLKDATAGYEQLKERFKMYSAGLIHGQMPQEEKDAVMARFVEGTLSILVSTTVIEVGVDVPNASIMIIEHAERFGLSQLHQLRGRVGRGQRQSYCILMHGSPPEHPPLSHAARFRLKKMSETNDGFEIAEADLKLRGPGDFLGTRQSGLPEFRFGDIVEDQPLLLRAKDLAWDLIQSDPDLHEAGHTTFKAVFEPYFQERMAFFGS